jgi:exo-poly-alpha-galacturonosidase
MFMSKSLFALLCGLGWIAVAPLAQSPDVLTSNILDVRSFGARGDGVALDTAALQRALDACAQQGGGTVHIPAGTYRSGALFIKGNHVVLELDAGATLKGSTDVNDYPQIDTRFEGTERKYAAALINGRDLWDVTLTGQGIIDGSGDPWWKAYSARRRGEHPKGYELQTRPRLICFYECRDVRVEKLTLQNPAFWNLHFVYCENVWAEELTIRAPRGALSSDGIDVDSCRHVLIRHCDIACDDDCISVKSGRDADGLRVNRPSEYVVVRDCTLGPAGCMMSMGSETAGGIRHVLVENCTGRDARNGLRLKTAPGRGGTVEDITYRNITFTDMLYCIVINMRWSNSSWPGGEIPPEATPVFRDITIQDVVGQGEQAGLLQGLAESPLRDIHFKNVQITAKTGLRVRHAPGIDVSRLSLIVSEGPALIELNEPTRD